MKKKKLFRDFVIIEHLLLLKIINSQQNQTIVKDILLMLNVLCNCIIHIYVVA